LKTSFTRAAAAVVALVAAATAQAAAPTGPACTASLVTDDLSVNPSYVACTGSFGGNLGEGTIRIGGNDYAFVGKSSNDNTGNGPFQAFGNDFKAGTLSFDQPWTGDFVVGLKAGNFHSLYRFSSSSPVTSITFDTLGVAVNSNGIGLGLSHAVLYGGVPAVPEPETYALLLAGIAVLAAKVHRRRRDA
jgi:hypothetical protein